MKIITDESTAFSIFEESAKLHGECTENGNYKEGNKHYKEILDSAKYLNQNALLNLLTPLLDSDFVGVQLWTATFLLKTEEKLAISKLREIEKLKNIHSLSAEMTLKMWKEGKLNLLL